MNGHAEHVRALMAALGCKDQQELAALLGVGPTAPTNWKQRGMPAKRLLMAQEIARARRISLPDPPTHTQNQAA